MKAYFLNQPSSLNLIKRKFFTDMSSLVDCYGIGVFFNDVRILKIVKLVVIKFFNSRKPQNMYFKVSPLSFKKLSLKF